METSQILHRLTSIEDKLTKKNNDRYMGMKELCEYTSLSQSTIHRNIAKGKLRVSRSTGRLLFHINNVKKWLNNG